MHLHTNLTALFPLLLMGNAFSMPANSFRYLFVVDTLLYLKLFIRMLKMA